MICLVIKGPTFEEAKNQISKALKYADLVELRLDYFESLDLVALKNLRFLFSIPMIFTLRSQIQGGNYLNSEEDRFIKIRSLMMLKPEYFDLESHVSPCFIEEISSQYPDVLLILSYHNFKETPCDLSSLYQEMQKIPASFYKIAVNAHHCLDAWRLICWAKKLDKKLIAISMGQHGQISRILGPLIGNPITYACFEEDLGSMLGQLSAKILIERYHYHSLNPHTALYGLIGDPVEKSISDETHNCLMSAYGLDAVYVKIKVDPSELGKFLKLAKEFPFCGLSVTMPFKEQVFAYLDHVDKEAFVMKAVNTLVLTKSEVFGFNTDGIGALNAIEKEIFVKGKRIVIIGAGGAARAIAYEALQRGAFVTVINRDEIRAFEVAEDLNCLGGGLNEMAALCRAGYEILINCTPVELPIAKEFILPKTVVMDITTAPKETLFLKHGYEKECRIIYGYKMFVEQALCQFSLWFGSRLDVQKSKETLENYAVESLSN